MRTFLLKSAPALAVLFVLIAGFMMLNDLDASESEDMNYCAQLWALCWQESLYASNTCFTYGAESSQCQWANKDARRVCNNAANYCDADN